MTFPVICDYWISSIIQLMIT